MTRGKKRAAPGNEQKLGENERRFETLAEHAPDVVGGLENSLKIERDRLVSILDSMTDGVYIVNQQYGIEYANPSMQREFGPFEGRKCHEYLVDAEEPCSWCKWPEILAGNTIRVEWMCPRNGKVYDSIDTPLRNPDGTVGKLKIIRDITERKHMEKALHEARENLERQVEERTADLKKAIDALQAEIAERREVEETLKKTFASLTEAVFVVDPRTRTIISCNLAVEEVFGYTEEEVIGRNTEFLHTDQEKYEEFGRKLFLALDSNGVFHSEHQMRRKDGTVFRSEHTVTEIVDDSGRRTGVVSVVRDITERVLAERMLRENEELLSSIFSSTQVFFAYMDKDFNFLRVNRAYAEADGRPPEFFVGKNHFDLYPHQENEVIFRRVVETGEPYFVFEKPFEYPDHPERGVTYWDWSLLPIRDTAGKVEAVLLSLVDVTGRRRAVEAQRETESRYRVLFENAKDGVFIVKRDGTFVDFNQAMIDLSGYSREELMRLNVRELYGNPGERPIAQRIIEQRGSVKDYEIKARRKNGRIRECLVTASVQYADDGRVLGYQGIIRDMTRYKRDERRLRKSGDELRRLSQKLLKVQEQERRLIARDLHDSIGGSLSAIKFSLGRKLDQMKGGGSSGEVLLENIISMVQRAIDENRRIMTELRPSLLDDLGVVETIDWFCREFGRIYPQIRIKQQVEIEESEVPGHLRIVIFRICQEALNNIARHSGGDVASLSLKKGDGSIELVIADNGQGFDVRKPISREVGGGMGISGMKERVDLSGGTFSFQSRVGEGTTVRARWKTE